MKTHIQNLLLLEDNPQSSFRIVAFLETKFSNSLSISTFTNGDNLLKSVKSDTSIVILDYDLKGEQGDLILQKINSIT